MCAACVCAVLCAAPPDQHVAAGTTLIYLNFVLFIIMYITVVISVKIFNMRYQ